MNTKNNLSKVLSMIMTALVLTTINALAQVASGGNYMLDQTVIANGGDTSNDSVNNNYKVEGTSGQSVAGIQSMGGNYVFRGGFWSPTALAPTAAGANISGRVVSIKGSGLSNIYVTLVGGFLTAPRIVRTNNFGYFSFEDVEVGQTYVLTVNSKKYGFAQNSQVISLSDNVSNLIFEATWEN